MSSLRRGATAALSALAGYPSGSRSLVPLCYETGSWCQCGDFLGSVLSSGITFSVIKLLL